MLSNPQKFAIVLWLLVPAGVLRCCGQWVPPEKLRNVPVFADCKMTRHGIGVSIQPNFLYPRGAIFLCPERQSEIERRHAGASRFFLIHEYGHLALHTREEAVADEWAARQMAAIPSEHGGLRAVLLHFVEQGRIFDPLYGTGLDRAFRVAQAARIPQTEWPAELLAYAKSEKIKSRIGTKLTLEPGEGYANAAQMIVYLDQQAIGFLSNVDEMKSLDLPSLAPGPHLLQAREIWVFHVETGTSKKELARRLIAETVFQPGGRYLALKFRFDNESVAIQVVRK
ncbi:MAG: hypothetical protein C5B58_15495 [Acidobacteria bacterium]|nr:MAG: hypothetical protein C5B58_15495 [Acidobacteriota bacterium]